jgi:hypothetical protein
MSDIYLDSERRYLHDPLFRATVQSLIYFAETEGATAGELRQIAIFAAQRLELQRAPAYSFGFGSFWVCPNRNETTSGPHVIAQQPGVCTCEHSAQLIELKDAVDHRAFPYRKL